MNKLVGIECAKRWADEERAESDKIIFNFLNKEHFGDKCCWRQSQMCEEGWCINCETFYDVLWEGCDNWLDFCSQQGQVLRILEELGLSTNWDEEYLVWLEKKGKRK